MIIFRSHNVYGPNMGNEHVIPEFINRMKKVTKKISKILYKKIKIYKSKVPEGSARIRCPDIKKIKKLGFRPKTKLKEGLIKTIEWYH